MRAEVASKSAVIQALQGHPGHESQSARAKVSQHPCSVAHESNLALCDSLIFALVAIGLICSTATKFTFTSLPNILPLVGYVLVIDILSQLAPQTRIVEAARTLLFGALYPDHHHSMRCVRGLCDAAPGISASRSAFGERRHGAWADMVRLPHIGSTGTLSSRRFFIRPTTPLNFKSLFRWSFWLARTGSLKSVLIFSPSPSLFTLTILFPHSCRQPARIALC